MNVPNFRKIDLITYKPGRSLLSSKKKVIKLSANESAFGAGGRVRNILKNRNNNISKYPDSKFKRLIETISKKFNLNKEKIICGAGSDEILNLIACAYLMPGDEVVYSEHAFLLYKIITLTNNGTPIAAKEVGLKANIENIINCVTKKTKIVFIANPNNPTGSYLNKNELYELRDRLPERVLLVIDGAYA